MWKIEKNLNQTNGSSLGLFFLCENNFIIRGISNNDWKAHETLQIARKR